jgi:hypothetical protein
LFERFGIWFDELVRHGERDLEVGCRFDGELLVKCGVNSVVEVRFDGEGIFAGSEFNIDAGDREPRVVIGGCEEVEAMRLPVASD